MKWLKYKGVLCSKSAIKYMDCEDLILYQVRKTILELKKMHQG